MPTSERRLTRKAILLALMESPTLRELPDELEWRVWRLVTPAEREIRYVAK